MAPAQEVDVKIERGLPGSGPHMSTVRYPCSIPRCRAISAAARWQRPITSASLTCASFNTRKMFLRDDQHMRGSLGADVFKGQHVLVFVDFFFSTEFRRGECGRKGSRSGRRSWETPA